MRPEPIPSERVIPNAGCASAVWESRTEDALAGKGPRVVHDRAGSSQRVPLERGLPFRRGGEGFSEHGLEEVGGASAGVLDLSFERAEVVIVPRRATFSEVLSLMATYSTYE